MPRIQDLDSLIGPAVAGYATERGIDSRWFAPITAWERAFIAKTWGGGSIRHLKRIIEAVLRAREQNVAIQ